MNKKYNDLLANLTNTPRSRTDSILMIDGLNTFLRSFSMINHINPALNHVGGLTGFLKSIGYAIRQINPTYVIVVFDGIGSSNNRRNLFPGYKANRTLGRVINKEMFGDNSEDEREAIANQMQRLMHYLQCLPISIICIDGLEADDVIGYLVKRFEKHEAPKKLTIMSADKDFLQLISAKTQVYSPSKKKIYQPADVLEEYGISSRNYIIQKILLGDSSDNVPGVPGLGPKKFAKMFPELVEETQYDLQYILDKSEKSLNEHKLFPTLLSFRNQLEINNQLMNLKEVPVSKENEDIIIEMASHKNDLNGYVFMGMYMADGLGESIPNVPGWLNDVFGPLHSL
jgi:DNA polymerase-1